MPGMSLRKVAGGIGAVAGFTTAAGTCGIKRSGKPDLGLIVAPDGCVAAGAFTRNQAAAPPVVLSRRHLRAARHHAIVVNSGNANCCTGERGDADALTMAVTAAEAIGCKPREVLVCSTGVIGVPLPIEKITTGIATLAGQLKAGRSEIARSILTTDLVAKECSYAHADGYHIGGITKGSGMIHPNMATMLGFVCTDVVIGKTELSAITKRAVQRSFNRISVDNDESTNDTCLVLASGASGVKLTSKAALARFEEALTAVCIDLAQRIVRDGEGATSFIAVSVRGAKSETEADRVASSVCDSMLVKTAFAGRDPNWGRIVAAAGYSGVRFALSKLQVSLNGVVIFSQGGGHDDLKRPFVRVDNGRKVKRAQLAKTMHKGDQQVVIDLGQGQAEATRWTSDLTHGYVTINADYTT